MIHDNNYAAGKTSAHDLRTVHDMGKSLPWIHYGRNMTNPDSFIQIHIRISVSGAMTGYICLPIWERRLYL